MFLKYQLKDVCSKEPSYHYNPYNISNPYNPKTPAYTTTHLINPINHSTNQNKKLHPTY